MIQCFIYSPILKILLFPKFNQPKRSLTSQEILRNNYNTLYFVFQLLFLIWLFFCFSVNDHGQRRSLRTAAALSFFNCGRIVEAGSTAAFLPFPVCGRINEQSARPQLCLFPIAAVPVRRAVRPHSAFSLFAAV